MNDSLKTTADGAPPRRNTGRKVAKWIGVTLGSVVGLCALILTIATLYLTPARLTELINRRASDFLNAEVVSHNARFTLWSTFPRLCIRIDSIRITSRSLDNLPASVRQTLPANYRDLAYCGEIKGGINLMSLLGGSIKLHDVSTEKFSLNLVSVNDTTANYFVLPPEGLSVERIPKISANSVRMLNPGKITFFSAASGLDGELSLKDLKIKELERSNNYDVTVEGFVSAVYRNIRLLNTFPFKLYGGVALKFNPFSLRLSDYKIALGNLRSSAGLNLTAGNNPNMDYFDFRTESFNLVKLLGYLPEKLTGDISSINLSPMVKLSARLVKPYKLSSSALPTIELKCTASQEAITYSLGEGQSIPISNSHLEAVFYFDGDNPDKSTLSMPQLDVQVDGMKCSLAAVVTGIMNKPDVKTSLNVSAPLSKIAGYVPQFSRFDVSGDVDTDISVNFSLPSLTEFKPDSLAIAGDVRLKNLSLANSNMKFRMNDMNLSFTLAGKDKTDKPFRSKPQFADRASLAALPHTPEVLTVNLPDTVRKLLSQIDYSFDIASGPAVLTLRHYPEALRFGDIDLSLTNDKLDLRDFSFKSGPSSLAMKGSVSGLYNFLTAEAGNVAPVNLLMDINIGKLNINALAKAYEDAVVAATGHAPASAESIHAVASDSVAMLIPRNINARIRATAAETIWTNLYFKGLTADILVRNGDAFINDLNLTTSFAGASGKVRYSSGDIQNMSLMLDLNLSDIDMKRMYGKFPTLVAAVPQITNFSGIFGSTGKISAQIYPNMAFDMNSLEADLKLTGRNMKLNQNKFIHRVVRMLGIRNSLPIIIDNLDVHAYVHDNLLELYPFIFGFDKYKIQFEGLNNFAGKLDYHVAVLKSPVPLRFGINITGDYSHPHLGFGRAEWNNRKSSEISSEISKTLSFNLVNQLKKYGTMFIHKAAVSQSSSKSNK